MADDDAGTLDEGTENAALGEALAAEHAAVWGYGVVGAALDEPAQPAATASETAHRDVRDQLVLLLASRDAEIARAEGGYALPFPVLSPVDAAALAVVLEDGVRGGMGAGAGPGRRAVHPRVRRDRAHRRRGARGGLAGDRRPDAGDHCLPGPAGGLTGLGAVPVDLKCGASARSHAADPGRHQVPGSVRSERTPSMSTATPRRTAPGHLLDLPGQTHVAEGPLDLNGMYMAHHAFRRDLTRFAAAARNTPVERAEVWRALAVRWAQFSDVLHHHHTTEDDVLWPQLLDVVDAAGDTEGRATLEAMEAEHELIDPLLRSCAAGFDSMARTPDAETRNRLADAAAATRDSLSHHLRHEETEALPLVQALLPAEGWERVEQAAGSGTEPQEAGLPRAVGGRRPLPRAAGDGPRLARRGVPRAPAADPEALRAARAHGLPIRLSAHPSPPRKASVTPTATLLDCPPSTRTAKAMSPCGPASW